MKLINEKKEEHPKSKASKGEKTLKILGLPTDLTVKDVFKDKDAFKAYIENSLVDQKVDDEDAPSEQLKMFCKALEQEMKKNKDV
mmetsp:Transcript_11015/g.16717  ORF Transcript_11015/g.16717 Transcript_11015/m.16717 type:complete len:85 (+) Transcript_11015:1439-1693(+)